MGVQYTVTCGCCGLVTANYSSARLFTGVQVVKWLETDGRSRKDGVGSLVCPVCNGYVDEEQQCSKVGF